MVAGSPSRSNAPVRSAFSRSANLEALAAGAFDVLVIGGGITGAGVALDAASRGLSTALVEKADFASGTSSKSSKLVHGGIRYLQQREFRLVYENLAERQRLLENAPHLVSPLPFLIPLFGQSGVVAKTVARSYSSALWLYDLTGGIRIGKKHKRVSRTEAVGHFPLLDTDRLVAGFLYYDARADDARLTLSLLRTAVDGYGAAAANYAEVVGFLRDDNGTVTGAEVRDLENPRAAPFEIRARSVVNATGVWTDRVRALGQTDPTSSLRPAKGVHVTVPASRFPADIAAVIPVRKDRRSIFVVPWPEVDLVYLGTTDTDYEGDIDNPQCTGEDVDYLLAAANGVSSAELTRQDVTGVWAGLRPLLSSKPGARVSKRTADLSRRHRVWTDPDGVVTVTGGKLTTYRKMAQDAVDAVCADLKVAARGAAFGDLFNEGKIDVIINPIDGPPVLLRNVNPDHHHWVEMKLVGGPKSPRDATCATAYLTANGMRQRQDVLASGSYISSNDRRLHFGLGDATDAGTVEIHWPSGTKETIKLPAVDRIYTITEGKGIVGALCGGMPCVAASSSPATPPVDPNIH